MTTLDTILSLLPTLTIQERVAVLDILVADPDVREQQESNRQRVAQIAARLAEDTDDDDSWWESFTTGIDAHRLSNRPLFTKESSKAA
jgi:hypothetical protein